MALASQSPRSNRSFQPSQRSRPQFILIGAAAVASLGAGWWLMRADAGHEGATPASPSSLSSPVPGTDANGAGAASTLDAVVVDAAQAARDRDALEAAPQSDQTPAVTNATSTADAATIAPPAVEHSASSVENPPAATPPTQSPASAPASSPAPSAEPDRATTPPDDAGQPAAPARRTNGIGAGERAPAATATADAGTPTANLAAGLATAASEPVQARALLSSALLSGELSPLDAKRASDALVEIGRVLAFTPVYNANDPMFFQYTIQSGDSLEKIVRRHKIGCDWRLVQRINNIRKPESIRTGQRLKLPKGPFSAVVSKRDYRVDICIGAGSERVVVTSLPCGLGSANGTPTGNFKVRSGSKLLNPEWTHPVTGEHYAGDDPKNPIGEHWLGLEGTDATNAQLAGYGIHGTIDVDSIGQDRSLGCVRLLADDVAIVWECLGDGAPVEIRK
jgi:LysM repeat protein